MTHVRVGMALCVLVVGCSNVPSAGMPEGMGPIASHGDASARTDAELPVIVNPGSDASAAPMASEEDPGDAHDVLPMELDPSEPSEPMAEEPVPSEPSDPSEPMAEEPTPSPGCGMRRRARLFDLFPTAPEEIVQWTGSTLARRGFEAGTDWAPLDEHQVFYDRLDHDEGSRSWDLRIGKGSQIYSLRAAFGEAVPPQRPGVAEWIDEVIQTVSVNGELHREAMGDESKMYMIHQAGVYESRLPAGVETSYSPMLARQWDPDTRRFATLVWAQQAHQPSIRQSHMLIGQQVRDVGRGAIEITHVYVNFGNDDIDTLQAPWMPLRYSRLPVAVFVAPDGTISRRDLDFDTESNVLLRDTRGYFMFASAMNAAAPSLGVVFGTGEHAGEAFDRGGHRFGWGYWRANPARSLMLAVENLRVRIPAHSTFFHRFYLVVGTLADVKTRSEQLVDAVDYGPIVHDAIGSAVTPLCDGGAGTLTSDCAMAEPRAFSHGVPVPGSRPLFVMSHGGTTRIGIDPYALSPEPWRIGVRYDDFLGFGVVESRAPASCDLVRFDALLASPLYSPASDAERTLTALRSRDACACD